MAGDYLVRTLWLGRVKVIDTWPHVFVTCLVRYVGVLWITPVDAVKFLWTGKSRYRGFQEGGVHFKYCAQLQGFTGEPVQSKGMCYANKLDVKGVQGCQEENSTE